ncbi:Mbeg1-like protein [Lacticaseibacillus thailandensis]|uniref:Mbeg1-like protein n=1 Tax=Lacticaseibacillus thailandensis TaxID=381741 RepID=UPI0006D258D8|nr:Mbeg1-like protein [Lacticaseibacillus thailandensis]
MATMLDYLAHARTESPKAIPLNPIEVAALAQLAYLNLDEWQYQTLPNLDTLATLPALNDLVAGTWNEEGNRQLVQHLGQAPRFRDAHILNYLNRQDPDQEQQFSVMTLQLAPQRYYIAFRGTRANFVDWKEDFNMTYMDATPSQVDAARYVRHQMDRYPGRFYLGGHSKGGNLATYAYLHAGPTTQRRVIAVYNLDGPGLGAPLPASANGIVHKLVPQNSVIGMIMERTHNFQVVQSTAHGPRQHDPFTWAVRDNDFVYLPTTSALSQHAQRTINLWSTAWMTPPKPRPSTRRTASSNRLKCRPSRSSAATFPKAPS